MLLLQRSGLSACASDFIFCELPLLLQQPQPLMHRVSISCPLLLLVLQLILELQFSRAQGLDELELLKPLFVLGPSVLHVDIAQELGLLLQLQILLGQVLLLPDQLDVVRLLAVELLSQQRDLVLFPHDLVLHPSAHVQLGSPYDEENTPLRTLSAGREQHTALPSPRLGRGW
jgi:hypothetical protein